MILMIYRRSHNYYETDMHVYILGSLNIPLFRALDIMVVFDVGVSSITPAYMWQMLDKLMRPLT